MFGHVKGAFTGAYYNKTGEFEKAEGGTIFLDEIGDMPLDLQAKILRVLQEQEITRIGGSQNIKINVRVIAATNQELQERVRNREFREDLYYRLNVVPINLPPLRERSEDIPSLVEYFLERACSEQEIVIKQCTTDTLELLCKYSWPGNVRELENTIKRAVILSNDPILTINDFSNLTNRQDTIHAMPQEQSLEAIVEAKLRSSMNGIEKLDKGDIYDRVLEQVERPLIRYVLEKTRGNQVRAADIMGINRNTLRKKINDLGIQVRKD
jgi:two-component system nitrogen regulation response regulator GlnG